MPRSLPVTTGLPRYSGCRACSHDAKKASPSMWTMARGQADIVSGPSDMSVIPADDRRDDTGDAQLFLGDDRPVLAVRRTEHHFPAARIEIFDRPFTVDLGDHD